MASMTFVISAILREASEMSCMVCTTRATDLPPSTAEAEAAEATLLACWAVSAFVRTVAVSSSIEAAVSSRLLACCSVRWLRSRLPEAISLDPVAMESLLWRTRPMISRSLSFMLLMAESNWAGSSLPCTTMLAVRSPCATVSTTETAMRRGSVIERVIAQASTAPKTTARAARPPSRYSARW